RFGTKSSSEPPREMTDEEEEAMLDAMAAEYGEAAAQTEPEPIPEEKPKPAPKKKCKASKTSASPQQSNLFDF
ncbi:MAG: hypothetical protein IJ904_04925, partial [Candidatus Methanomethylophilaceae archaeon]|nr:hypothetical protein [Candidatus Methanomethylophilaceae archaeon]